MAAIATQGTGLRHVRKTINFDGSANNGNLGDAITAFVTTGVVAIKDVAYRCTESIVCAAPADVEMPFGTSTLGFGTALTPNGTTGQLWENADGWGQVGGGVEYTQQVSSNLVLRVEDIGVGADVTDGTIIIDLWYRPITDDGALAGDDIDTELVAAIRKQQMTELYAADGVAPTMEQALFAILQVLTEAAISGTTMTVKKLDGSTTAFTLTLNDANTPTGITRAT